MNLPTVLMNVAIFVLNLGLLVFSFRASRRNWKKWRRTRGLHLISATGDQLRQLSREWPGKTNRWPDPFAEFQTRGQGRLWRTYASLAASRETIWRYWSDGVIVVSGATFGVQLPGLVQNYILYSNTFASTMDQPNISLILAQNLPNIGKLFVSMISLIGIIAGLILRLKAESFKDLKILYTEAADLHHDEPVSSRHGRHRARHRSV